jgi:RNA polymerase sigma-70 factor, ECF subfamily
MQSFEPSPGPEVPEITRMLRQWQAGDAGARERVVEAVYAQVRAIAGRAARAASGGTLTPTELAHEVLIRLLGAEASWEDRRHFFHVVAQGTRQILIDAARRRLRDKRGGGARQVELSALGDIAVEDDATLLRVNEALEELGRADPRRAQVIELTYFGGFERGEIAQVLGVSVPTIDRDLRFGRAWLKSALQA